MTNNRINIKQEYIWTNVYVPAKGIDKKLIILNSFMMLLVSYFAFTYFFATETKSYGTAVLGVSHTSEVSQENVTETMKIKSTAATIQSEVSNNLHK
jgi:hypothetical protein